MKIQKEMLRDSYGKVGYINIPYENTGSTCNIKTNPTNNKELDNELQKLSDILDELYEECEINEFFENKLR
ncbi:TPA: CJH_07325 family protein [Campylobacter lari]|nr:CJH_07325 family protein [Campylobacter lari]